MSTEEVIREIISKLCPFHGKHATVKVHDTGHVNISACCTEFHKHMESIIAGALKNSSEHDYQYTNNLVAS